MLSCCVCLCARIISKMLSGLWCSRGVLFFCFWSSCRDRFPACIQICDSPEKPIGEAYSPRRCQVPDSEQMLTNTNAPEGPPVCVCMYGFVCFPPSSRRGKTAGSGPRRSRTSSHGHLPVHNASQKTDKPELLFISHRCSKWSSVLSLIHTLQTHRLCSPVDFSCLSLCSGPSCLVRGWKSTLQQAAEAYTQQSNIWRRVFSPNGKTCVWLQCSSCSKHPLQNI